MSRNGHRRHTPYNPGKNLVTDFLWSYRRNIEYPGKNLEDHPMGLSWRMSACGRIDGARIILEDGSRIIFEDGASNILEYPLWKSSITIYVFGNGFSMIIQAQYRISRKKPGRSPNGIIMANVRLWQDRWCQDNLGRWCQDNLWRWCQYINRCIYKDTSIMHK